jgi:gamma-glutamylcyclotransferase (GGCT)/AIG2-like uncharacterized protein YtfP
MSDAPVRVFVYGTLMRGCSRHHHLSDGRFDGEATADGRLISIGEYPALIDGAGSIRGELYAFEDVPAALDVLDDVEDFDAANPEGSEFVREARRVCRDDGTELIAWLYVYNRPRGPAPIIPSGDWRKRS